jgi:Phosphotransferase enzyme family
MLTSTALADSTEDLTPAWFTAALQEGGVLGADDRVEHVDAGLYGTGQFGLVARAQLGYAGPAAGAPDSVIVKLPSDDPGSRQLGVGIGAYEAEVRFYQEIAPRSSIDVPQLYWASYEPGTGRVTLVLEDLSRDWQVGDAVVGGTVEQAGAALEQIARIHGELWDDPGLRKLDWLASPARTEALFDGVPAALPAFRERFADRLEPQQFAAVERLAPKGAEYPARAWTGPMVVAHGDFRLDNVMFRRGADGLQANVIDWQAVRLAPPMVDAAIWLSSCLSATDRRRHQDALLRAYHERLEASGVEGFTFDDCIAGLRVCSLYVFLLSVGVSVTLAQSGRGDELFAGMVARAADFVTDMDAAGVLD